MDVFNFTQDRENYFFSTTYREMGLHSHKINLTLSLYVNFQIRKKALYGRTTIQTKTKGHDATRFKNHSFENLKCKSVYHQTVTRHSTTNFIQFAELNHNNGHFLI